MFSRSRESTVLSDFFPRNNLLKQKKCCWLLYAAWQRARETISAAVHNTEKPKTLYSLSASSEKYFYCHKLLLIPFSGRKLYVEIEFLIIGNCAANSLEIYLWVFLGLHLRNGGETNHRKILRKFILIFSRSG